MPRIRQFDPGRSYSLAVFLREVSGLRALSVRRTDLSDARTARFGSPILQDSQRQSSGPPKGNDIV
jgi:hypothetical protein